MKPSSFAARALPLIIMVACGGAASTGAPSLIPPQPPQPIEKPVLLNDHVVRGHVYSANGKPLVLAHAHLMGPAGDNRPVESVQVAGDGSFTLPLSRLPAQDKLARIQLSGVDHRVETLIVALDEAVDVEVKLGTYRHAPLGGSSALEEKPTIMLFLPGGSRSQHPLERHASDGTYTADIAVKDGPYGYEITGLTLEGHTINGTTVEEGGYTYDDDGDYESRVNVTGGKLRVVFDPSKRPPSGLPSAVKFANESSVTAGLTEIFRRVENERTAWQAEAQEQSLTKGGDPKSLASATEKKAELLSQSIATIEKQTKHALVRQAAAIAYFQEKPSKDEQPIVEEEKARAQRVIEDASSGSLDALFTLFPAALPKIIKAVGETSRADAIRRTLIDTHPSPQVVAHLLGAKLHSKNITIDERREIVQSLRSPRFRGTSAQRDAELMDPDRLIGPGKPMPSFEVRPLPTTAGAPKEKPITPKAFEGKVYLVDLWATWCKPCLAELPSMHELFAKYGGVPDPKTKRTKQFAIMSVSLDEKPETVTKFRNDKAHPMPWLQAFAGSGDTAEAALKALTGKASAPIPFYVLVDDKGKIVASSPELRLSEVPAMLDRLLL